MIKLFSALALFVAGTIVSVYSLSVQGLGTTAINFTDFQNKKILLVNTASGSSSAGQLAELQQLYLQHQDSMVIIAFPSNSFGNEPGTNTELDSIMRQTYGLTFPIARKSRVRGDSINAVYEWIKMKEQNGIMNRVIRTDFQKVLINSDGQIVATFDSSTHPLSTIVQDAISNN